MLSPPYEGGAGGGQPGGNKVFAPLLGRPLLYWTVAAFATHPGVDGVVIIAAAEEAERCWKAVAGLEKILAVVPGGANRQESVAVGLYALGGEPDDLVLVHDGARPLVTADIIDRCIAGARRNGSAVAAVPVADTLKEAGADGIITRTLDRTGLWAMQTPQAFRRDLLYRAHVAARDGGFVGTDEAALAERLDGVPVHLVAGSPENIKITRPDDLALAEAVLRRRGTSVAETRVGFGYDVHRFAVGRALMLGGVAVPDPDGRGLEGHSDADVLLHALCDALLGAAGLPDIGVLFPNTDPAYEGIASVRLLESVAGRVRGAGFRVVNVDATVIAEAPRIAPHVPQMRAVIAGALGVEPSRVGIKATTHEGLGALGRSEGIAAQAVASLVPA